MVIAKVSAQLAKIVGSPYITRKEGFQKVWEYVKLNNLQNPANKAEIKPDKDLYEVFQRDTVYMTQVLALLKPHYEHNVKAVYPKKPKPTKTVIVTKALQRIIGSVESRTTAMQMVWEYIKKNNLQNPEKKSEILCDPKLHAVVGWHKFEHTELMTILSRNIEFIKEDVPEEPQEPTYVPI